MSSGITQAPITTDDSFTAGDILQSLGIAVFLVSTVILSVNLLLLTVAPV